MKMVLERRCLGTTDSRKSPGSAVRRAGFKCGLCPSPAARDCTGLYTSLDSISSSEMIAYHEECHTLNASDTLLSSSLTLQSLFPVAPGLYLLLLVCFY